MSRLLRKTDGAVIVEDLRVASSYWARLRGLMGKRSLDPGEGLWLEPCSSIHMMFMRFAIDVLFVERELGVATRSGEVLKVCANVRPWLGMAWCLGASSAVELEAGRCAVIGVQRGDKLELEDVW